MKNWQVRTVSAFALTLGAAAVLSAAPAPRLQDGWLAWQGCWRAAGDSADRVLCIVPDGNAARLIEFSGGKVQSETRVATDGVAHPVSREGCTGTEQARWSEDQQRLFTVADMKCGESMRRKVSGLMAMKSPTEWLSVQSVSTGGQAAARTRHYSAVSSADVPASVALAVNANALAGETARYAASQAVDLSDVAEAVHAVDSQVVVDWLTELGQPFDLTGRKLLALADSGVPSSVIDVLVAVSNPEHFAVRTTNRREDEPVWARGGGRVYDPCYGYGSSRGWSTPYGYGYDPYGWGWGSSYNYGYGCGYTPWGYDPWGWRYGGRTVVVVRGSDEDHDNARVTRGGYTSGTSKGKAKPRGDDSPRTSVTRGASEKGSSPPAVTRGSSGGSSGATSSGGSSTGRTAKPKDK